MSWVGVLRLELRPDCSLKELVRLGGIGAFFPRPDFLEEELLRLAGGGGGKGGSGLSGIGTGRLDSGGVDAINNIKKLVYKQALDSESLSNLRIDDRRFILNLNI